MDNSSEYIIFDNETYSYIELLPKIEYDQEIPMMNSLAVQIIAKCNFYSNIFIHL